MNLPFFARCLRSRTAIPVLFALAALTYFAIYQAPSLAMQNVGEAQGAPSEANAKNDPDPEQRERDKQKLARFNDWIGDWRGVGQVKRNSARDSWLETANWQWHFQPGGVSLLYQMEKSNLFPSAELSFDNKTNKYRLVAQLDKTTTRKYTGDMEKETLVLDSQPDSEQQIYRVSFSLLNPKRLLVLHQKRQQNSEFWNRIAEVGYTRKGTSLARPGAGQPECIVTGGTGTIVVAYQGKEYFVCCSGCKQAFDDDPAAVITDYKKRIAEQKEKLKQAE